MNKKIQTAEKAKTPYMLIAGDREVAERTVAVRRRGSREQTVVPFDKFHALVRGLRASRSLELPAPVV
jgi:threonyl-tRNA synthetase